MAFVNNCDLTKMTIGLPAAEDPSSAPSSPIATMRTPVAPLTSGETDKKNAIAARREALSKLTKVMEYYQSFPDVTLVVKSMIYRLENEQVHKCNAEQCGETCDSVLGLFRTISDKRLDGSVRLCACTDVVQRLREMHSAM